MAEAKNVGRVRKNATPSVGTKFDRHSLAARVRSEHTTIRTLLDDVERACVAAKQGREGALERFRRTVWDLYLVFDQHLAMEEAHVAPILRAFDARGEERAVNMILEHNEQRRVTLELVEDAESDAKHIGELVAAAMALVVAFRTDIAIEDRALALVLVA